MAASHAHHLTLPQETTGKYQPTPLVSTQSHDARHIGTHLPTQTPNRLAIEHLPASYCHIRPRMMLTVSGEIIGLKVATEGCSAATTLPFHLKPNHGSTYLRCLSSLQGERSLTFTYTLPPGEPVDKQKAGTSLQLPSRSRRAPFPLQIATG